MSAQFESGRGQLQVERGQFEAQPRDRSAKPRNHQLIKRCHQSLSGWRESVRKHVERKVAVLGNAQGGTDHDQPGQGEFSHFFDPEEVDRIDVHPVCDGQHDIA